MRKIIILFIFLCLCGCSKNLEIKGKITEIKYNDVLINSKDYDKVIDLINIDYNKNEDKDLVNKLTIKTTKDIYYFSLDNENIKYGDKSSKNDKLNTYLQDLTKKYTDKDFFTIDYMKNYESNNDDDTILLDKTSNYIVINFGKKVSNLKINEIEIDNNQYMDVDLLYTLKDVGDKVIIRKTIDYDNPDIRISFKNEYGYTFSIIPFYDDEKLEFKTNLIAK